jgi:hypothetical protein
MITATLQTGSLRVKGVSPLSLRIIGVRLPRVSLALALERVVEAIGDALVLLYASPYVYGTYRDCDDLSRPTPPAMRAAPACPASLDDAATRVGVETPHSAYSTIQC